ncbi:hypothetical protein AB0M47_34870 [Hamadaea sp. NPDC051192]|uniref:hypothetical protein n=1 Tax=Hamadaea sp. NPDC051192 TaxID=3154940 RepID=UPI0034274813
MPIVGRQLVVTDPIRHGRYALTLGFAEVTLVGADAEDSAIAADAPYDLAAIDLDAVDVEHVARIASLVRPHLRRGGVLAVLLGRADPDSTLNSTVSAIDPGNLDDHGHLSGIDGLLRGWEWAGLSEIGGEPAAVFRPGPPEAAAGTPFLAAYATASLLTRRAAADGRTAEAALAEQVALTARSERALLARLAASAEDADRVRRDHQGSALVRTLLRRSKGGRVVLRVAKTLRRR